jgi:hypothetical protein
MSDWARDHARRLLAEFDEDTRRDLAEAPLVALERLGYVVQLRPESGITGDCTVSGSYKPGPPPTITIVESASRGRQYFTGLHELGHRLVAADDPLQDAFAEHPDKDRKLEEDVCDAVAGELLLPDEIVDRHIGDRGPTAASVVSLFRDHQASREATCVRASQRIGGSGHVMLLRDGVARFTATANSPYRVRRGTPQLGGDHPVARATAGSSGRGEGPVRYASGAQSDPFFVDAATDGTYVFAVFVDSKPAWGEGLTMAAGATVDEWGRHVVDSTVEASCPHCEVDFQAMGAPCPTCKGYYHRGRDGCEQCSCGTSASAQSSQIKRQTCGECFIEKPMADFTGDNTWCNECLGL